MKLAQMMPEVLEGLAAWFGMVLLGLVAFFNLKGNVAVIQAKLKGLKDEVDCKADRELMDEKLDRIAGDVSEIKSILNGK